MKLKDTIKLLKYTQSPQLNIVVVIIFGFCAIITSIPAIENVLGAFWANYMPMYFVGQISVVTFAGVVQSSEKFKKLVTKNLAILLGIANAFNYLLFVVVRSLLAYKIGMEAGICQFLVSYMLFQILYVIYGTVIYKNIKLGILFMVPIFLIIVFSSFTSLKFIKDLAGLAGPKFFILLAAVVSVLTPILYYGLTCALYKLPYSEGMVKRAQRQEAL